jgi:hypothetical protein
MPCLVNSGFAFFVVVAEEVADDVVEVVVADDVVEVVV